MRYNYFNYANPNDNLYFEVPDPVQVNDGPILFQLTDGRHAKTAFEELYASSSMEPPPHSSTLSHTSDSDTGPVLSMNQFGQQLFPEPISHAPCHTNFDPHLTWQWPIESILASQIVQQDYNVPPTTYYDPSYIDYTANESWYSTAWESDVHLHTNSQAPPQQNHITTGMLNYNIPDTNVMRQNPELGYSPGSGYNNDYTYFQYDTAPTYEYRPLAQDTQPITYDYQAQPLVPTTASQAQLYPQARSPTHTPPLYFSYPINPDDHNPSPSSSSSSVLFPVTPTHDTLSFFLAPLAPTPSIIPSGASGTDDSVSTSIIPQTSSPAYTPLLSFPHSITPDNHHLSPSSPSTLYPVTPTQDDTPSFLLPCSDPAPASPIPAPARPLPKKRARKSKKATTLFIPDPAATERQRDARARRGFLRGRAPVRSREYLERYYPNRGPCLLCEKGTTRWREDRALEHLVSTHILQVVKKLDAFEEEALYHGRHLVRTEAQFELAQKYLNEIKCSLCPHTTSLVFRDGNIKDHVERVHKNLPESTRQAEVERLSALEPNKYLWYSFHDKFLYQYALVSKGLGTA